MVIMEASTNNYKIMILMIHSTFSFRCTEYKLLIPEATSKILGKLDQKLLKEF